VKLKIYTHAEFGDGFLSREVLDALESPRHVRQGRVYVWARTAKAAAEYLTAVGMSIAPRKLRLATGNDSVALDEALPWPEGTVLATRLTGGAVVELSLATRDGSLERVVRRLGDLDSVMRFRSAEDFSVERDLTVTRPMLDAAVNALTIPDGIPVAWLLRDMKKAIAAALKVQREAQR
jgi:hypothetical protein